jgi:hypothetical protein
MSDNDARICRDYGDRPGCKRDADERYTMRFDDIGEQPIYWCAHCGPDAHAISAALDHALKTRGPQFAAEVDAAIDEAREEIRRGAS